MCKEIVPGHEAETAATSRCITALVLKENLPKGKYLLLDVRERHELEISKIEGAINIPYGELAGRADELDTTQEIVVFCRTGVRSLRAIEILLGAGFSKLLNLEGGINSWARDVDKDLPLY